MNSYLTMVFILSLVSETPRHFALALRGDHDLIGWSGETYNARARETSLSKTEFPSDALISSQVELLSWQPRAWVVHKLLTEEECDHLIQISSSRLQRSGVVDVNSGRPLQSNIRTSQGTFLGRGQDPIVDRIEDKIATWTMIPKDNGEGLQVLKYKEGQEYQAHFDYFFHAGGVENGGNRMATVLLYLNTPEEGGETVFPIAKKPRTWKGSGWSDCGKNGLGVRPKKGDALLFWSLQPNGLLDTYSKHAGCPVLRGEKWTATKWMHVGKFMMSGFAGGNRVEHTIYAPSPPPRSATCNDKNENFCRGWAEQGECILNPQYMKDSCKYSCGAC